MSIFKDTFKEGVKNQLKTRQKAIFERTPDAIQYFNARNSWIRMTSSVNVGKDDGSLIPGVSTLAKSYVLLGGTLYNGKLRSGVGTDNKAYSLNSTTVNPDGTIKQEKNRLGIRPMPGITSIDIKSKSAYGSLREVVVNFNCWDIRQLEELELLYMRPGYSVLVEWGWAPYLDNNGKLQNNISFTDDVLNGGVPKEQIWKNIFTKASKDGNYDAHYGIIKNYSWSARPDGGYDCTSTIISIGEVLESLKVNYTPADTNIPTNGLFNTLPTPFKKDSNVQKSYSQNKIAGICNELYLTLLEKGIDNFEELQFSGWTFFRFNVDISNSPNTDSDFDDEAQIYILLKDFIDILNKHVILHDQNGKPIPEVSVNEGDHMGKGENKPLLCLAHPLQLSIDPSVCLIKNNAWLTPSNLGFEEGFTDDFDTLTDILNGLKTSYWYNNNFTYDDKAPTPQLGVIGNIYVNLGYIYSLVNNKNLESQDKKEKNDIILFDFLKNLMSGISNATGNVATFDIFSDPIDSAARIIDVNYTDDQKRQEAYDNAFMFELQNTKSVIRNYKFESQIFPDQTTIVAIGAQAKGGALGADVNTLIDFNQNLFDRIIPKKEAPDTPSNTDPIKELEEKVKNLKENINIIVSFINEIDPAWYSFTGTGNYDTSNASKYNNALKDLINFFKTFIKNDNKNRAIIPTKLSLEMDGIGGMVIGNLFRIPNELLPRGYRGGGAGPAKIAYTVNGLGHSLQGNDWVTNVDSQFIILDEPRGGISLLEMNDIKIIIEAASENTVANAVKKIGNIKAGGATKTINGVVRKNGDIEDLLVPIKPNLYSLHYSSVNQSDGKRIRLQAEAMQNLEALLTDAFNNKIYIKVNSAYRTREDQERIKADSVRTRIPAATPGTSNHGFGLAVDLANASGVRINPNLTPKEWKWIQENKGKYGFENIFGEKWNTSESHHYNFIK
jgi:hypothetical protein